MTTQPISFRATDPADPANIVTTVWSGAVSGSFSTAGNWSNGVPTDGDTAIYANVSVDCDTNLAQSGIDLEALLIHDSFTGNIGDGTSPLEISANLLKVNKRTGFVHLKGAYAEAHTLNTAGDTNALKIQSTAGGDITDLFIYGTRSDLLLDTDNRIVNCYAIPMAGRTVELQIKANASHTQTTLFADRNSYVSSAKDTTNVHCDGGVLTLTDSAATTAMTVGGGTIINQCDGTHTLLTVWNDGTFSMHQNEDSTSTITDATLWGGLTVLRNNLSASILTNPVAYWGGELWTESGQWGPYHEPERA